MELVLYHGSERIIMQPRPDAGSGCRDFGRGFYCTRSPDMAREWSVSRGRDGFVSRYILDRAVVPNLPEGCFRIENVVRCFHFLAKLVWCQYIYPLENNWRQIMLLVEGGKGTD